MVDGACRILHVVRRRLENMYALSLGKPEKRQLFDDLLECRLREASRELLSQVTGRNALSLGDISWIGWLSLYRLLLTDFAEIFGLPGEIEPSGSEVELRRPDPP
jgi:hypothetical protein